MGDDLEARARAFLEQYPQEWAEDVTGCVGPVGASVDYLADLLRAVRDEEREACARECEAEIASYDSGTHEYFTRGAQGCMERIRARGER